MSEIKNRNIRALEQFYPKFCQEVLSHERDHVHDIQIIEGQDVTLQVDGMQLTSRHDRKKVAQYQCRALDFNKDIHVFGLGLGDEIRFILQRLSDFKEPKIKIIVHILCPCLFCSLLHIDDELYTLFNPSVSFSLNKFLGDIPHNSIISINELRIESNFQNALKQKLINHLEKNYAQALFERTGGEAIKKQLAQNSQLLIKEKPLKLSLLPKIEKALILASGPSLGENISAIKQKIKEDYILIAADTALGFLEDHHIYPQYIVTIDVMVGKFAGVKFLKHIEYYKNTTLIYAPWSDKRLWQNFSGPKFFISSKRSDRILPFLKDKKADPLWYSGSVAHAQISLAVELGAKLIELLGVDLAFDNEYSHAGIKLKDDPYLAELKNNNLIETLCNDGKLRPTQKNFTVYKEDLESYIKAHPNIAFKSLSAKAALILGCEFCNYKK